MIKGLGINADVCQWAFATIQLPPGGGRIDDVNVQPVQPENIPDGFFVWAENQIAKRLDVTRALQSGEDVIERAARDLGKRVRFEYLTRFYRDHVAEWDYPNTLGVVHPYSASPAVRRALPVLLDGAPIPSASSHPHPPQQCQLTDDVRISAIDAPSAACLELVAAHAISLPARLVLLTGPARAAELAAVHLWRSADTLHLELQLAVGFNAEKVPPFSEKTVQRLRNLRGRDEWRIVYFGATLQDAAEWVHQQMAFGEPLPQRREPQELGVGAARYAAMCSQRELPGEEPELHSLRIRHLCPRPLGIICSNGRGRWYWRKITEAGEPLDAQTIHLAARGPIAQRVLIAEARSGSPGRWIKQADWEGARLRVFATANRDQSGDDEDSELHLQIINPTGEVGYRWSDPDIRVGSGLREG